MSPDRSPEQRAKPEQPLDNEMPEVVLQTPEMKRQATEALERYIAGLRRAEEAPRLSPDLIGMFRQSRSDTLSLARKKEDPAKDIQTFNRSADAFLLRLPKTERPAGFAKLPQQTDLSKGLEAMNTREKMDLLRSIMERKELNPDIRRRVQQLDIARTLLEDQLVQTEEPKTRWGRFMNVRRKLHIPALTRAMGLSEREEDARETLHDAHRFTLETQLPEMRQNLFTGANSFMGEVDRHPYLKSILQEAGLSVVDAQTDEEILVQYTKLVSYLNKTKSYERAARLVEELLPEEFREAEKNIPSSRHYELVRDALDHAKRIRVKNEEAWRHPSQQMLDEGAKPMTDGQIAELEQGFYEEKRNILIHEEAAKYIDGKAFTGGKAELWSHYNDIVNPNGAAKKETWDKIFDEVAINAPLIMASGGIASAARAGLSKAGCLIAGKILVRQAVKTGIEAGSGSALEIGTSAVARWAGTNALKRGTLAAAGLVTEGAAFELAHAGLTGDIERSLPEWGTSILWSAATLGAFHGSGKLSERLFSKTVMEGGRAVTRDVLLGNYLSGISNGAVREVAKQLLAKGHIEAATMMLVGAIQNGAYDGNLDEFFKNFGDELLHSYITVGALKAGHAGVRAVIGKPEHAKEGKSVNIGKETKHPISPEVTQLKDYLKSHPIDDATRVQIAESLLGRTLSKEVTDAILASHGKPGAIDEGNMTKNIFKEGPIYDALRAGYEKTMPAEQAHERAMKETKLILDAGLQGAPRAAPNTGPIEQFPVTSEVLETRQQLRLELQKNGTILPEDHPTTRLLRRVAQQLGLPDGIEIVCVDTEESFQGYHPTARQIVTSREFLRFLAERIPNASEDHLAAYLAHELQHRFANMKDWKAQRSSVEAYLNAQCNQAEELRADAEGMETMAHAGYDPKAMPELLESGWGLKTRGDKAHPDNIDRIRHLQKRFANDEHPIPNIGKTRTPLDQTVRDWSIQKSEVYSRMDHLLSLNGEGLRAEITAARTPEEVKTLAEIQRNRTAVGRGKALLSEPKVHASAVKKIALEALTRLSTGKLRTVGGASGNALKNTKRRPPATLNADPNVLRIRDMVDQVTSTHNRTIAARTFREGIESEPLTEADRSRIERDLRTLEESLDTQLATLLGAVQSETLPSAERDFLQRIQHSLQSGDIDPAVFCEVYAEHDLAYRQQQLAKSNAEAQQAGRRGSTLPTDQVIQDLRDPAVRQAFQRDVELQLAIRLSGSVAFDPATINHLSLLLQQREHLDAGTANILSTFLLQGIPIEQWAQSFQGKSNAELLALLPVIDRLSAGQSLPISKVRKRHAAYAASISQFTETKISTECRDRASQDMNYGLDALRYEVCWEILRRGSPPKEQWNNRSYPSLDQLRLTPEEFDALAHGPFRGSGMRDMYKIRALQEFQNASGDFSKLHPAFQRAMQEMDSNWPLGFKPTPELILLLIEHNPWSPEQLQYKVSTSIQEMMNSRNGSNQDILLRCLQGLRKLAKDSPAKGTDYFGSFFAHQEGSLNEKIMDIRTGEGKKPIQELLADFASEGLCRGFIDLPENARTQLAMLPTDQLVALAERIPPAEKRADISVRDSARLLVLLPAEQRPTAINQLGSQSGSSLVVEQLMILPSHDRVQKLTDTLGPSLTRDLYLIAMWERVPVEEQPRFAELILPHLAASPDGGGRSTARVNLDAPVLNKSPLAPENPELDRGEGIVQERYPDLLQRRYPFSTRAERFVYGEIAAPNYRGLGNPRQRFIAELLLREELFIFGDRPFSERLERLRRVSSAPSVVRDTYLEHLLQRELARRPTPQEIVSLGETMLPLFTKRSEFRKPYAVEVMRARLTVDPKALNEYAAGRALLEKMFPEASLARNHFLDLLEAGAPVTPEQLHALKEMRITPEGQQKKGEGSLGTLIFSKLADRNRDEKMATYLWVMGLSTEKPELVKNIEKSYEGHLDNAPKGFAASTPPEQEHALMRLCLGDQGILDLATVDPAKRPEAQAKRTEFLRRIAKEVFPTGAAPQVELFQQMFVDIFTEADAVHGTQILTKLTAKMTEYAREGKRPNPAETAALMLGECGVIGKKVAQSLAELPWMPKDFANAMKEMQQNAQKVHKRALLALAEGNGLIDGSKGIRIVSFDTLIGAASNKQVCLVTVEVTDPNLGLPLGQCKLVGKFKRPSAQKAENISHDVHLLEAILKSVETARDGQRSVPPGFAKGIQNSVTRELNFPNEATFARDLGAEIARKPRKGPLHLEIPTIAFAGEDVILESLAKGITMRDFLNAKENGALTPEYAGLDQSAISQLVLTESLAQLLVRGNVHADLHPGNVFVAPDGTVTLIDLGMHERLTIEQRQGIRHLLQSLTTGSERGTNRALQKLGWNEEHPLQLRRFDFSGNVDRMMLASTNARTEMPVSLSSILTSTSKLGTYSRPLSLRQKSMAVWNALRESELKGSP